MLRSLKTLFEREDRVPEKPQDTAYITAQNASSPLLRLPLDLRLEIYNHLRGSRTFQAIKYSSNIIQDAKCNEAASTPVTIVPGLEHFGRLMRTCHALHHELQSLYFKKSADGTTYLKSSVDVKHIIPQWSRSPRGTPLKFYQSTYLLCIHDHEKCNTHVRQFALPRAYKSAHKNWICSLLCKPRLVVLIDYLEEAMYGAGYTSTPTRKQQVTMEEAKAQPKWLDQPEWDYLIQYLEACSASNGWKFKILCYTRQWHIEENGVTRGNGYVRLATPLREYNQY